MAEACKATGKDGNPCRGNPQNNSDWCYFHDPARTKEDFAAAGRKGRAQPRKLLRKDIVRTPLQLARFLAELIADVHARIPDPGPAVLKAIATLSSELRESWKDARRRQLDVVDGRGTTQPQAKVYVLTELDSHKHPTPPLSSLPQPSGSSGSKTGAPPQSSSDAAAG